jgi:hypothetical protein
MWLAGVALAFAVAGCEAHPYEAPRTPVAAPAVVEVAAAVDASVPSDAAAETRQNDELDAGFEVDDVVAPSEQMHWPPVPYGSCDECCRRDPLCTCLCEGKPRGNPGRKWGPKAP